MSALSSPTAAADRNANATAADFAVSYGAGFEPAPDLKVINDLKDIKDGGQIARHRNLMTAAVCRL